MRVAIRSAVVASVLALLLAAIALPAGHDVLAQAPEIRPLISAFDPTTGLTAGGTKVTITGSTFQQGARVEFAGIPATNIVVVSDTVITVTAPAGLRGPAGIMVINPDGKFGVSPIFFTYQDNVTATNLPLIQSVTPGEGSQDGGTVITIIGARFQQGATVTLGSAPATNVKVVSEGTITATTPPNAPGASSVTVRNPDGQVATSNVFAFIYGTQRNPAAATPTPVPSGTAPVLKLPATGFSLIVFTGGTNAELVRVSGCPATTAAFWASDGKGSFVTYVPGTSIAAVSAGWNAQFPSGAPAGTALIARCAQG